MSNDIVEKYIPYIYFDKEEPFQIKKIGYTIFEKTIKSPSFKRNIVFRENTKFVIEYAVYWDFDIEHLYDLEHLWVYVDKQDNVYDCEGSFHGKYLKALLKDKSNIQDNTHVRVYSQPGKHAFAPYPEVFELIPTFLTCTYETVGKDGLIMTDAFKNQYETSDDIDKLVIKYMQRYKFIASMKYERHEIPKERIIEWNELYRLVPQYVTEKVKEIRSEFKC